MAMILLMLAGLCSLASFACHIMILIAAFTEDVVQGILSLCIPFYILYYAFVRFQNENKAIILGVWLGGAILGAILQVAAGAMASGGP
jgi:hypothetical protein